MHAVGQPELQRLRLAEALLPAQRRLREVVQGTDRDYRVGEVRPQERQPALPRLYGPLRLRTHGGDRRDEKPQEYAGLDPRFVLRERRDGAIGRRGDGATGRMGDEA